MKKGRSKKCWPLGPRQCNALRHADNLRRHGGKVLPHRLLRQRDRQEPTLPKQRRRRSCFGICGPV